MNKPLKLKIIPKTVILLLITVFAMAQNKSLKSIYNIYNNLLNNSTHYNIELDLNEENVENLENVENVETNIINAYNV